MKNKNESAVNEVLKNFLKQANDIYKSENYDSSKYSYMHLEPAMINKIFKDSSTGEFYQKKENLSEDDCDRIMNRFFGGVMNLMPCKIK